MTVKIDKPILFLVFNRPDKTQKVFDIIRKVKPLKLYVAADAPRDNVSDDLKKCQEVKDIVSLVDWECSVKYLYHKENQGCSLAGYKAWKWFFEQEEEMIFVEDDGLISESFFNFAQEMLLKYKDNNQVAYIYGDNFEQSSGNDSYFFTQFACGTYSMATWKRVFDLYEYKLDSYSETINDPRFRKTFINKFHYDYTKEKFLNYLKNGGNTYDLQIAYLTHKYNMINIVPNINLVSNIGYDIDGSNTNVSPESSIALKLGNRIKGELNAIKHPIEVKINPEFEKEFFKVRVLYGKSITRSQIKFYIKRYINKLKKLMKLINKSRKNV